jgi:beta-N-acetylhexosaminidase
MELQFVGQRKNSIHKVPIATRFYALRLLSIHKKTKLDRLTKMKILCLLLLTHTLFASWAENTLQQMTQDEKIGQLFMLAAYIDPEHAEEIDSYIQRYRVGGLAFVGPSFYEKQVRLTNHYQEMSKYPLLIAQDLEWGLSMRIKDALRFPKNITLGAVHNQQLIYDMGKEVGRQAKLIGVHMNLSPVLDVNIEPENLAINVRSFGASPEFVAEKGILMIKGLQDAGIIASAKHFPGLGDITVDPHLDLPYSAHDRKRLDAVEFYPFVQAIEAGVMSIQTEHLLCKALDDKNPASLSHTIVTEILKNELGFQGVILSGALRMKALTNYLSNEEIALKAFLAGSDMLLMPQDLPAAFQALKQALTEGKIEEQDLNARVLKILQLKEQMHLDRHKIIPVPTHEQLHSPFAKTLKASLYQQAVAVLRGKLPPLADSIAYIQLGEAPTSGLFALLSPQDSFKFPFDQDPAHELERLISKIDNYSQLILAVYPADPRRIEHIRLLNQPHQQEELKNFRVHGLPPSLITLANTLRRYQEKTIVTYFGNPFGLPFFEGYETLIMAYEPDPDAEEAVARMLMGVR